MVSGPLGFAIYIHTYYTYIFLPVSVVCSEADNLAISTIFSVPFPAEGRKITHPVPCTCHNCWANALDVLPFRFVFI